MNISKKIQELRKNKGLSQEQFAERLGVSRQAVSKWESNQSCPDIEKIALISELFGVSTDYLIKGDEEQQTEESMGKSVEIINLSQKLFIMDVNKRKMAAFNEFGIDMLGNKGEADLITGMGKSKEKVKVPVCLLYGISKGILGIDKRVTLGYYSTLEDAQQELKDISEASKQNSAYELKYAAKMQGIRILS